MIQDHEAEYVDLQVNGYAGVDFNSDQLSVDQAVRACQQMRSDGVARFLPAIITASPEEMTRRLQNIVAACEADDRVRNMVAGIHIEGPFLNPADGTVGAHPREHVQSADLSIAKQLVDASAGLTKIFTLAPEVDSDFAVTRWLTDAGITVSAGHCDPSWECLKAAADAGLAMFTHVGNGCSLTQHRHDNIVQRVLSLSERIWCCFIADGIHIPPFALANYLKAAGIERSVVVTDAMAAAGLGPGRYQLGSQTVHVDEHHQAMLPGSDGRLAGSVATMPWLRSVLSNDVGLDDTAVRQLLIDSPARVLGNDL